VTILVLNNVKHTVACNPPQERLGRSQLHKEAAGTAISATSAVAKLPGTWNLCTAPPCTHIMGNNNNSQLHLKLWVQLPLPCQISCVMFVRRRLSITIQRYNSVLCLMFMRLMFVRRPTCSSNCPSLSSVTTLSSV